jgi:Flp pilus assembly secretin CpaC
MGRNTPFLPFRVAILTAVVAAAASPAAAASRLSIGLNQSIRVPLGGFASSVVVANPTIADVTMVDAHSVVIIGKANGSAEVMVLDSGGKTLMDSIVSVSQSGDRTGQDGDVTLFLGSTPHEFVCSPRCAGDSTKQASNATPPS